MTAQVLIAKTTYPEVSDPVSCNGFARITIGMRALDGSDEELSLGEYVGCEIIQENAA